MLPSFFSFSLMPTLMLITIAAFATPGGAAEQPPTTHILDGESLMVQRERVRQSDPDLEQGIGELSPKTKSTMPAVRSSRWSLTHKSMGCALPALLQSFRVAPEGRDMQNPEKLCKVPAHGKSPQPSPTASLPTLQGAPPPAIAHADPLAAAVRMGFPLFPRRSAS